MPENEAPRTNTFSFLITQTSSTFNSLLLFVPYYLIMPTLWQFIIARFDEFQVAFVITFTITTALFWIHSGILSILDLYRWPAYLWRYKVQPAKHPDWVWYVRAAKQALFLQISVNLPMMLLYYLAVKRSRHILMEPIPGPVEVALHFLVFGVIEELGFYYGHSMLHTKTFYRAVHKKHHEFTAPIGLAAIYAHPFEHFLSNVMPLALGPLLMRSHFLLQLFWICFGQATAINSHCGFAIPGFPSPLAHDYHHQVFNANYGVLGVLDWWHGTTGRFVAWKAQWEKGVRVADVGKEEGDDANGDVVAHTKSSNGAIGNGSAKAEHRKIY